MRVCVRGLVVLDRLLAKSALELSEDEAAAIRVPREAANLDYVGGVVLVVTVYADLQLALRRAAEVERLPLGS